ncbi:hypothetical protein [Bradyrhizobium sp. SSUT77]|nr:hypothetical protein [Bradyrhizobium sp. SSUT77]MDH2347778.1 hypothetical protein [Bradyrhizobium sp. SSUT77]
MGTATLSFALTTLTARAGEYNTDNVGDVVVHPATLSTLNLSTSESGA